MPNLTVAVVGDNTIDRYVGRQGGDYVGGNAVNVAVQLAERGYDVHYFGAVGPDAEGDRIRAELVSRGVTPTGLVTLPGATALTVISVDDTGDRHMDSEMFGVTAEYHPSSAALTLIANADWIQIGMLPRATAFRGAVRARRPDARIGQDCSVADGYQDLTVVFESTDTEHAESVAKTALAQGAELVVTTLGAEGATAFGPAGQIVSQPALTVDAVDTTGAGDSFIAGFVASFLEVPDVSAAMTSGAQWAARTCSHFAGFPQPTSKTGA
jgi:fructoselysine 6-kinase